MYSDGISISILPNNPSRLYVSAIRNRNSISTEDVNDIEIKIRLDVASSIIGSPLESLVKTTAYSLLGSLSNEIGSLIMSNSNRFVNELKSIDTPPLIFDYDDDATATSMDDELTSISDSENVETNWLETNAKDISLLENELSSRVNKISLWSQSSSSLEEEEEEEKEEIDSEVKLEEDTTTQINHFTDVLQTVSVSNEQSIHLPLPPKESTDSPSFTHTTHTLWTSSAASLATLSHPSILLALASIIRSWSARFSDRGTGLFFTPTRTGVDISFSITSSFILHVYSDITNTTSDSCMYRILWQLAPITNATSIEVDKTIDQAITTAANNLMKSLQKELLSLALDPVSLLALAQTTHINPNLTPTPSQSLTPLTVGEEDAIPVDDLTSISSAVRAFSSIPPPPTNSHTPLPQRKKDPVLLQKARAAQLRLESFEDKGLEQQAQDELDRIIRNSKQQGFLAVLKRTTNNTSNTMNDTFTSTPAQLEEAFSRGSERCQVTVEELLSRSANSQFQEESVQQLLQPTPKLPVLLRKDGKGTRMDLFEGPVRDSSSPSSLQREGQTHYFHVISIFYVLFYSTLYTA